MTIPFPARLPDDIDDHELIVANDWAAFEDVDFMVNHWDRPGWHPGRRSYHWILSFDEPDLSAMAQKCFQACASHAFDQVPLDVLHLTIRRIGFADEIDRSALDAVFARAEALCSDIGSFPLMVGPLAASRGAIRFSVAPWSTLFDIYDAVGTASRQLTGREPGSARESFRPHISIAYSRGRQEVETLRQSIIRYRTPTRIACKVSKIELVELRRESGAYRWQAIRSVDLALNQASLQE